MKTFVGTRGPDGAAVHVQGVPLDPRRDLADHSPTGFEWGYGGSGPAQLALAILATVATDSTALALYQRFKWEVVVSLPPSGWRLREATVRDWILDRSSVHHGAWLDVVDSRPADGDG